MNKTERRAKGKRLERVSNDKATEKRAKRSEAERRAHKALLQLVWYFIEEYTQIKNGINVIFAVFAAVKVVSFPSPSVNTRATSVCAAVVQTMRRNHIGSTQIKEILSDDSST